MKKITFQNIDNKRFSFIKNEKGTSLVEFALLGPIFLLLLLGVFHLGIIMVIQNALEAGAREAARYGITGQSQAGKSRADSILQVVQQTCVNYSGGIIRPSQLVVSVKAYPSLTLLDSENGSTGSFGLPGQAVLYKISYVWDTIINIFGENHIITLQAQTPVVNEQFS